MENMSSDQLAKLYLGPDGRLNSEGRSYVGGFVTRVPGKRNCAWPQHIFKQYNACTDPCDMWTGPCACGAAHNEGV